MHDRELEDAVLLGDEAAVGAILAGDPARALSIDGEGRTLVMKAVALGAEDVDVSLPVLGLLLDAGVDLDAQDAEGQTALGLAVGECPTEVVRFLLARGADPNLGNPLIHALWSDGTSTDDLRALLDAGADPRAQELDGMDALEWAEDGGVEEFVRLLRRAGRPKRRDA